MLEQSVQRLVVETSEGLLGILPRHVDCVAQVVPGVLTLVGETTGYVAVDRGTLVKRGAQVTISTREAVRGDLATLVSLVQARWRRREEREGQTRSVLSRLEANFVRRFLELSR